MKNIGTEMEKKLKFIGINSAEELASVGSNEAFFRLKFAYPNVCLVHLYSLQGAIDSVDFNMLTSDTKKDLKAFSDSLK